MRLAPTASARPRWCRSQRFQKSTSGIFFDELPTGVKNTKEIKTPVLVEMSLAAHGPRLIDAFLKLKTDKLRGAVTDLVQALARAG
jgi:hypothetical protein